MTGSEAVPIKGFSLLSLGPLPMPSESGIARDVSVPGADWGPQAGSPLGVVVATGPFDSDRTYKLNLSRSIPSLSLGVLTPLPGTDTVTLSDLSVP